MRHTRLVPRRFIPAIVAFLTVASLGPAASAGETEELPLTLEGVRE